MTRHIPKADTENEETIREVMDWKISISSDKKHIYIKALSYHAPKLELSKDDIKELLDLMDNKIK